MLAGAQEVRQKPPSFRAPTRRGIEGSPAILAAAARR